MRTASHSRFRPRILAFHPTGRAGRKRECNSLAARRHGRQEPGRGSAAPQRETDGHASGAQGEKRARFLSDIILRWLKKRFPDIAWPKMGDEFGRDLTQQMARQMGDNGILVGDKPVPSIKIKVKFKPPRDWEISIEISF